MSWVIAPGSESDVRTQAWSPPSRALLLTIPALDLQIMEDLSSQAEVYVRIRLASAARFASGQRCPESQRGPSQPVSCSLHCMILHTAESTA
jgi:hypothetical protein